MQAFSDPKHIIHLSQKIYILANLQRAARPFPPSAYPNGNTDKEMKVK